MPSYNSENGDVFVIGDTGRQQLGYNVHGVNYSVQPNSWYPALTAIPRGFLTAVYTNGQAMVADENSVTTIVGFSLNSAGAIVPSCTTTGNNTINLPTAGSGAVAYSFTGCSLTNGSYVAFIPASQVTGQLFVGMTLSGGSLPSNSTIVAITAITQSVTGTTVSGYNVYLNQAFTGTTTTTATLSVTLTAGMYVYAAGYAGSISSITGATVTVTPTTIPTSSPPTTFSFYFYPLALSCAVDSTYASPTTKTPYTAIYTGSSYLITTGMLVTNSTYYPNNTVVTSVRIVGGQTIITLSDPIQGTYTGSATLTFCSAVEVSSTGPFNFYNTLTNTPTNVFNAATEVSSPLYLYPAAGSSYTVAGTVFTLPDVPQLTTNRSLAASSGQPLLEVGVVTSASSMLIAIGGDVRGTTGLSQVTPLAGETIPNNGNPILVSMGTDGNVYLADKRKSANTACASLFVSANTSGMSLSQFTYPQNTVATFSVLTGSTGSGTFTWGGSASAPATQQIAGGVSAPAGLYFLTGTNTITIPNASVAAITTLNLVPGLTIAGAGIASISIITAVSSATAGYITLTVNNNSSGNSTATNYTFTNPISASTPSYNIATILSGIIPTGWSVLSSSSSQVTLTGPSNTLIPTITASAAGVTFSQVSLSQSYQAQAQITVNTGTSVLGSITINGTSIAVAASQNATTVAGYISTAYVASPTFKVTNSAGVVTFTQISLPNRNTPIGFLVGANTGYTSAITATAITGLSSSLNWTKAAYSPTLGMYVAVASGTNIAYKSYDGKAWSATTNTLTATQAWNSIVWANNRFIAVGGTGTTVSNYSVDGGATAWTSVAMPALGSGIWTAIDYSPSLGTGSGLCVAIASNVVTTATSIDLGVTWVAGLSLTSGAPVWTSLKWSPELALFVATASGATTTSFNYSSNPRVTGGTAWATSTPLVGISSLSYAPAIKTYSALASGTTNQVYISIDGINWSQQTLPSSAAWNAIEWSPDRGHFLALADSGATAISYNGTTWTSSTSITAATNQYKVLSWSSGFKTFITLNYTSTAGVNIYYGGNILGSTPCVIQKVGTILGNWAGLQSGLPIYNDIQGSFTTNLQSLSNFNDVASPIGYVESSSSVYVNIGYNTQKQDANPIGSIVARPSSLDYGWLTCNGTYVSRATYGDLFNVAGTTFGVGDGNSTFNLPLSGTIATFTVSGTSSGGTGTPAWGGGATGGTATMTGGSGLSFTALSNQVTLVNANIPSNLNLIVGATLAGANITAGTTISSIAFGPVNTVLTLSVATTGSGSTATTYTFSGAIYNGTLPANAAALLTVVQPTNWSVQAVGAIVYMCFTSTSPTLPTLTWNVSTTTNSTINMTINPTLQQIKYLNWYLTNPPQAPNFRYDTGLTLWPNIPNGCTTSGTAPSGGFGGVNFLIRVPVQGFGNNPQLTDFFVDIFMGKTATGYYKVSTTSYQIFQDVANYLTIGITNNGLFYQALGGAPTYIDGTYSYRIIAYQTNRYNKYYDYYMDQKMQQVWSLGLVDLSASTITPANGYFDRGTVSPLNTNHSQLNYNGDLKVSNLTVVGTASLPAIAVPTSIGSDTIVSYTGAGATAVLWHDVVGGSITIGDSVTNTITVGGPSTSLTLTGSTIAIGGVATSLTLTGSTIAIGGVATSLSLGGTVTTASPTFNIATNATASTYTKTVNIGTGGVSGSTTNIVLGTPTTGATSNVTIYGNLQTGNPVVVNTNSTINLVASSFGTVLVATTASTTVTLPQKSTVTIGYDFYIKNRSSGTITIQVYSGDGAVLDGTTSLVLNPYESIITILDASGYWNII